MNTNIISYIPRDKKGRFTNFRKKALKVLVYQLIILSVLVNLLQFRQAYNFRCAVNGQVIGWFVSKDKCAELAQDDMDAKIQAADDFVKLNPDLFDPNNLPAYAK